MVRTRTLICSECGEPVRTLGYDQRIVVHTEGSAALACADARGDTTPFAVDAGELRAERPYLTSAFVDRVMAAMREPQREAVEAIVAAVVRNGPDVAGFTSDVADTVSRLATETFGVTLSAIPSGWVKP